MTAPLLAAKDISKRFGENGVLANDRAHLELVGGSIHAVVGENGAGKSTLMHILAGTIRPDSGTILVRGEPVIFMNPADALESGVVMSFQHPRLVRSLTVWENMVLGSEPRTRFGAISRIAARRHIEDRSIHISGIDLDARVHRLSSGQVRLVSLMAAMHRLPTDRPGVLILDEPTAACGPAEAAEIFKAMRAAAGAGHGVVYITHKIAEIADIADSVTVMRAGSCIVSLEQPFSADAVADHMLGRTEPGAPGAGPISDRMGPATSDPAEDSEHDEDFGSPPDAVAMFGEFVLEVRGVSLREGNLRLLDNVSFSVRRGEILGLTGNRQSGIEAIEEVLGAMRRPSSGTVTLAGKDLTGLSPHALRRWGVGYVPTDRLLRGASLESSVAENLIVLERKQLQRAGIFLPAKVRRYGNRLTEEFEIDGILHTPLGRLSGGNIQKVILGRELAEHPRLLIICEPSWGLDVRSRSLVAKRIRAAAASGAAVVIISTDMDEVLDFADTIGAFYGGRLAYRAVAAETDRETLGRSVFGSDDAKSENRGG